jgi:hypothetical protein
MSEQNPDKYVTTLGPACPIVPSRSDTLRIGAKRRRSAHMGQAGKGVAWLCIFSTLLWGCYSSAAILEPAGEGQAKLPSGKIFSLVTKDSTRYEFITPATVVEDSIVGKVRVPVGGVLMKQRVSIPLSNVAYVSLKKYRPVSTIVLVVAVASGLIIAGFSASLSGWHISGK